MNNFRITILIIALALFPLVSDAAMNSTNYQISSDSFNAGGAIDMASANYKMDVTIGEQGTGFVDSSNYTIGAGFQYMQYELVLSLTISDTSMSLGTLTTSAVATDNHTLTVTTTNGTGYTMTIQANNILQTSGGGADIDNITENTQVTAGTEGYGVALTGGSNSTEEGDFDDDDTPVPTSATNILSSSVPVTDEASTVTYRAGIDSNTTAGSYSQTITYSITANA